ncbi:MAG TPA: hypothetical protein PKV71_02735 [Calditrichia bacterium]|nr:hypothetical protein [Calditrichota bacterium]HQU71781.1 hypothetical protein [Calditrichia bacterium]HQV30758.1 hypothetical protein [Calditrichia bacterium]
MRPYPRREHPGMSEGLSQIASGLMILATRPLQIGITALQNAVETVFWEDSSPRGEQRRCRCGVVHDYRYCCKPHRHPGHCNE